MSRVPRAGQTPGALSFCRPPERRRVVGVAWIERQADRSGQWSAGLMRIGDQSCEQRQGAGKFSVASCELLMVDRARLAAGGGHVKSDPCTPASVQCGGLRSAAHHAIARLERADRRLDRADPRLEAEIRAQSTAAEMVQVTGASLVARY